jgi:hypothetical protein
MTEPTKGPFEAAVFKCAKGDKVPGVRAVNGVAVCWCHGSVTGEDYANAELIAKALNSHTKLQQTARFVSP